MGESREKVMSNLNHKTNRVKQWDAESIIFWNNWDTVMVAAPGHQQQWYWLHRINKSLFSMTNNFNCLYHQCWEMIDNSNIISCFSNMITDIKGLKDWTLVNMTNNFNCLYHQCWEMIENSNIISCFSNIITNIKGLKDWTLGNNGSWPDLWLVQILPAINTLRPRQNGRHFADDIFKRIFLNDNIWIQIKISLKFVPKGSVNNIPALVKIMAWRRPGDKPLSEPMMVSLLTHICVTQPQWVKPLNGNLCQEPVKCHLRDFLGKLCLNTV